MPDTWPDTNVAYSSLHGTPFRLLNFNASSPSSLQQTQWPGSGSYPDWAMLDLFYVPSSFLSPCSPYEVYAGTNYTAVETDVGTTSGIFNYAPQVTYLNTNVVNNMYLYGTYGGATSGRINPNGSVIYTTNANVPTPGITRTLPLGALLYGITYNQTISGPAVQVGTNDFWTPSYTGGTTLTGGAETNLAAAIASYLTTNTYGPSGGPAPLRMPGEICNVPAISALMATQNPQQTRNDLVRQIIGNLTTQSNTFSVWVAGQSIQKSKLNSNYGTYESGDQITANVRYHFIVERDLDPGIDGVYGNASSPGNDGVIGTLDDPAQGNLMNGGNAYNSAVPGYVYRIVYAEEIR